MRLRDVCMLAAVAALTAGAAQRPQPSTGTTAGLRGLSAVGESVVWASGTGGTFVRSVDGGATWQVGAVPGAESLDFRDVEAFGAETAYLLSIGRGESSRIYKTSDGGKNWTLQFKNADPDVFLDAMAFWDAEHGLVLGDPVRGRFLILATDDGGKTWAPAPPEGMPPALPGEAAFAASGTCIAASGARHVWFGTGGAAARVFRSTDRGRTWSVAETPVTSGAESAGIFSVAFRDERHGVAVGGDYRRPEAAEKNAAVTDDGGRTWRLLEKSRPAGYRSGVAWARGRGAQALIAVGTSGADYSMNGGADWVGVDRENSYSTSFGAAGAGWVSGPGGRVARIPVPPPR